MTDDLRLDRAIDTVARRMTAAEPPAGMRARIVEGLDDRRPFRHPRRLMPVAVVVAVILVAFGYTVSIRERAAPAANHIAAAPAIPRSLPAARPAAPPVAEPHVEALPRIVRVPIRPSDVDALAPPPLAMPSIAVRRIAPAASIEVAPLEDVEPIAIVPLDQAEGDRR